jgi:hypothetical protein
MNPVIDDGMNEKRAKCLNALSKIGWYFIYAFVLLSSAGVMFVSFGILKF